MSSISWSDNDDGLCVHGGMRALAAAVLPQRRDQVSGILVTQLGHTVFRIYVLVVDDSVASVAGIELLLAVYRIARRVRAECSSSSTRRRQATFRHSIEKAFCSPVSMVRRMLGATGCADVNEWACKMPLRPDAPLQKVRQILQQRRVRGLGAGRIAAIHPAIAIDEKFLEIPIDVARKAVFLGRQPRIQRMAVRTVDVDLRRQGKGHAEIQRRKSCEFPLPCRVPARRIGCRENRSRRSSDP